MELHWLALLTSVRTGAGTPARATQTGRRRPRYMAVHILYGAVGAAILLVGLGALAYWVDLPVIKQEREERRLKALRSFSR